MRRSRLGLVVPRVAFPTGRDGAGAGAAAVREAETGERRAMHRGYGVPAGGPLGSPDLGRSTGRGHALAEYEGKYTDHHEQISKTSGRTEMDGGPVLLEGGGGAPPASPRR
ncbi:hypothetical protein GCM10010341_45300 [Streptomyces noursei]|nr:hypothetical protein GCM10010341_45300 [Streptomyces noursei]